MLVSGIPFSLAVNLISFLGVTILGTLNSFIILILILGLSIMKNKLVIMLFNPLSLRCSTVGMLSHAPLHKSVKNDFCHKKKILCSLINSKGYFSMLNTVFYKS